MSKYLKKHFDVGIGIRFFEKAFELWFLYKDLRYVLSFGRGVPNGGMQSGPLITAIKEWYENDEVVYAKMLFHLFDSKVIKKSISELKEPKHSYYPDDKIINWDL